MREFCGAVSASAMVIGSLCAPTDADDTESKQKNYEIVREFSERFKALHSTVICRELLCLAPARKETAKPDARTAEYYKKRPCLKLVEDAAEILTQIIEEYEQKKSS